MRGIGKQIHLHPGVKRMFRAALQLRIACVAGLRRGGKGWNERGRIECELWCKSNASLAYLPSYIDNPSSKLNDGFWHQIVAVWSGGDKSWFVSIDGVGQGWKPHPTWPINSIPAAGTLLIGQLPPSLSADSSKSFLGRITLFNMWDKTLETSRQAMLARGCRNDPGNLFSWSTLKSNAANGELKIIEPSSCMWYWCHWDPNYFKKRFFFDKKNSEI